MKSSIVAFCLLQATSFSSFSWVFANFSFHSPCFGYSVEELFYFMDLKHAFPSLLALTPTAFVYHIVLCWYGLDLQMTSAFFILVYVSSIVENVWLFPCLTFITRGPATLLFSTVCTCIHTACFLSSSCSTLTTLWSSRFFSSLFLFQHRPDTSGEQKEAESKRRGFSLGSFHRKRQK